jgi:predicted dienelactone hydrolase
MESGAARTLVYLVQYSLCFFFPLILFAFEPHPVTPYPVVGYREISFYDDFHKIQRQLLIWYPVDPQVRGVPSKNPWDLFYVALNAPPVEAKMKMPVIVISHGYTGNPHQLSWLIRGLVYHRFIVIGIQHLDLREGRIHANHWQRALDIRTILDQFLASSMANFANTNQIGIAGYSLGGTTSIWIAGGRSTKLDSLYPGPEFASPVEFLLANQALPTLNKEMMSQDWRDARVKAAFIMAPAWAWLFDEASLAKITIPTYLIAAAEDRILVTRNNAGFFARHIPSAIYQVIPGKVNHFIFISALNSKVKDANSSMQMNFLFEDDVSVDRAWIQLQTADEAVRFFKSFL